MATVYSKDPKIATIMVGRDRLKGYSADERKKAESLKNPQTGTALAGAIAARVADSYFDMLAGDKEEKTRKMQAALLAGEDPYLAALAESGAGKEALSTAAQRKEADRIYARSREDAARDAEEAFKRKVKFERIKAGIRAEAGPDAKDIDVIVKTRPDGQQEIVRINKVTGERLPVGTMGESVRSVVKSAKTLTGDARPGPIANPQVAGTPEGADAADPARGQTVMGVPATAAAPAQAAPAQAEPAPAQPVPQGVNVAELYKRRARNMADAEAKAPEEAARAEAKRNERITSLDESLKNLFKIREYAEPNPNVPSQMPESSSGTLGDILEWVPGNWDSKQVRKYLNNIQSEITIGKMKELKELSPTGATGFGSISLPELVMLQNSLTTLDKSSSPENFREQVKDTILMFQMMRAKANGDWSEDHERAWRARYDQFWGKYGRPKEDWNKLLDLSDEERKKYGMVDPEEPKPASENPATRGRILRKLD